MSSASKKSAKVRKNCANCAGKSASVAQKERWQHASAAALRGAYRHELACRPGVLGDACGSPELEWNERARLRDRVASVAVESAQVARPVRRRRGGDRLAGASSFERRPANKHWC